MWIKIELILFGTSKTPSQIEDQMCSFRIGKCVKKGKKKIPSKNSIISHSTSKWTKKNSHTKKSKLQNLEIGSKWCEKSKNSSNQKFWFENQNHTIGIDKNRRKHIWSEILYYTKWMNESLNYDNLLLKFSFTNKTPFDTIGHKSAHLQWKCSAVSV